MGGHATSSKPRRRRLAALASVLAIAVVALGCGQSEEEKRRDAFKDNLRTSLEAQQVPDELTDCLIDVVDKTLTDEMIALVPPNVGAAQLATIVAQNTPQLSTTCPAAAQAFSG
jgi:ABC-type phosphate/phosphonate transport system substrate-binding protein